MSDTVLLAWPEIRAAMDIALHRHVYDSAKKLRAKRGATEDFYDGLTLSLPGCLAEIAVAKFLNMYWTGVAGIGVPDVGGFIEVRSIRKDYYGLRFHPEDKDDLPSVLANVKNPEAIEILGWAYGRDAKKDEFWKDPSGKNRPFFLYPQNKLKPMSELFGVIYERGIKSVRAA